MPGMSKYQ